MDPPEWRRLPMLVRRTGTILVAVLCAAGVRAALCAPPASQPAALPAASRPGASSASRPAVAARPRPPVEKVRSGIRCPVIADTQVSFYKGRGAAENERLWNYGKADRLKLKGFEEYVLLKFDTRKCRGMTVSRATLYLPRTDQCDPAVIGVSGISTDWVEGSGRGQGTEDSRQDADGAGGATALWADGPATTWAGAGSNLKWVIFGEGGSAFDARPAGAAREADTGYVSVDVPLDVVHGLLVDGDSCGLCLTEEKGQRAFNKTYIDPPDPNHFIFARESGKAAFLVIEAGKTDRTPPAAVGDPKAEPGGQPGEVVLSWLSTGDDGTGGGKALGYRVYASSEDLAPDKLNDKTLLPRYLTPRPLQPGQRQVFPVSDLQPGTPYHFAVVAYDEAGNASVPAFLEGRTRQAGTFALQPHTREIGTGSAGFCGPLQIWACPSNCKINPVTGNSLDDGDYTKEEQATGSRAGNEVWDGRKHRAVLFAGRNDFAGLQVVLQNTGPRPITNIHAGVYGMWQDKGMGFATVEAARVEISWQWSCRDSRGVYWPDALLPLEGPLSIPNPANRIAGQTAQSLYVDLYVPHETQPGSYTIALQIQAGDLPVFVLPIDLTVWDFELPDTLSFLANMYSYNLPRSGTGGDAWEGALNMYRLAHRNRLNLKIIPHGHDGRFTNPYMALEASGKGKDRRIVSFEKFDRCYGPLLDGSAFADCPRKGVPVADITLPIFENFPCSLKDGFAFDPYGTHLDIRQDFTAEYAEGFVAVCRQMAEHFRERGYTRSQLEVIFRSKYQYAPTVTYWLLDEPMFRDDYLALNYFAHLVRLGFGDLPNVRLRTDCSRVEEAHGLMNEVDTFCGTMSNLREYRGPMRDMLASYVPKPDGRGRTLWVYGGTNKVDASNVANRAWCIDAWLFGADAVVPWLAFGPDEALDKAGSADQAVFYPGKRFDYNGVYGSLRMKAFRDGQQDVECLVLLAKRLGATRREMAGLLRSVCSLEGQFTVEHPEAADTISYAQMTPDDLVRLRRTIGYNLHLLAGKQAPPSEGGH